ncbi:MAG: pirin family protein [Polyangia bacterium]|jgi:redox-sensitive bicupin YhaK (pirin superfamily)|nr:pirin family protein [Polyangia bacterium]
MAEVRQVRELIASQPTVEGAGVRLRRVFGFGGVERFDPFLLLDHFGSSNPEDYLAGFPWHPHRGIETITYMLDGLVEHGDSLGNSGTIGGGDVQWMTAGSGIIHQEMPRPGPSGQMWGFQLWANLPASQKMMDPRYRDLSSDMIPEVGLPGGGRAKVIAGSIGGASGPMDDIVIAPELLDLGLPPGGGFVHPTPRGHTLFVFVFEGAASFGGEQVPRGHLALMGAGDSLVAEAGKEGARFLLVSGKPLGEPIAWRGPIVMNTQAELQLAFEEFRAGTFVKVGAKGALRR